jgi:hypothetical protein
MVEPELKNIEFLEDIDHAGVQVGHPSNDGEKKRIPLRAIGRVE